MLGAAYGIRLARFSRLFETINQGGYFNEVLSYWYGSRLLPTGRDREQVG